MSNSCHQIRWTSMIDTKLPKNYKNFWFVTLPNYTERFLYPDTLFLYVSFSLNSWKQQVCLTRQNTIILVYRMSYFVWISLLIHMYINFAHFLIPKISALCSFAINPLTVYIVWNDKKLQLGNYRYLLLYFALFNISTSIMDMLVPMVSNKS